MSEAKHTPGPWDALETQDTEWEVVADDGAVTLACPPSEADARLIAAAPELLAALVKLHTFIDFEMPLEPGDWGFEDPTGMNAAMAEAHEIIRKATGQA